MIKKIFCIVFAVLTAVSLTVSAQVGAEEASIDVVDASYYEQFRDAFHGNGSFIYNWSRNLSGEMFGVFAYYLASPFMLILVLLPRTMMATSMLILQLAKITFLKMKKLLLICKILLHVLMHPLLLLLLT